MNISLSFCEWVLDCLRGALSIHLLMAYKNMINFHLLVPLLASAYEKASV